MGLNDILIEAVNRNASDIHMCVGLPPVYRVNGELLCVETAVLGIEQCEKFVKDCISTESFPQLEQKGQADFSYRIPGIARFRVNAFKQRNTLALAFRIISTDIPPISKLGLPEVIVSLAEKQRGLVLVTGPTGSGKSTTLASMVDYVNTNFKHHIITIEDPIEYLHKHKNCVINQREINQDTNSYSDALRAALREDPDVILIGEMRDQETIATALTAAETGHLVFSTLHTLGSAKTIDRIIDVFSPHQQSQVRSQLSTVLQGIVSQQLMRKQDGSGRVVATEVMTMTPAIANLIREARTSMINSCIHTGTDMGMHSMDSCIARLYKEKVISYDSARQYSIDPENLNKLIRIN